MDKCPFCGAIKTLEPKTHCDCGYPIKPNKSVYRPGLCYERQLASQTALLREALVVVEEKASLNPWPPEKGGFASGCQFCGKPYPQWNSNAEEHYGNCSWVKAKSLAPKIKAALGEKESK